MFTRVVVKNKHNHEWELFRIFLYIKITYEYCQTSSSYIGRVIPKQSKSVQVYKAFGQIVLRCTSLLFARFDNPCSQKTARRNGPTRGSHCVSLTFWPSIQWLLSLYLRKDYMLSNEFKRLRESSLEDMNKIEPKMKWSVLPPLQSWPLEYLLLRLF